MAKNISFPFFSTYICLNIQHFSSHPPSRNNNTSRLSYHKLFIMLGVLPGVAVLLSGSPAHGGGRSALGKETMLDSYQPGT